GTKTERVGGGGRAPAYATQCGSVRADARRCSCSSDAVITPSETASYARLLAVAGALDAAGREKLAEFAERSFTGDLALQIAYDIVAGRRRPLAFALVDALA